MIKLIGKIELCIMLLGAAILTGCNLGNVEKQNSNIYETDFGYIEKLGDLTNQERHDRVGLSEKNISLIRSEELYPDLARYDYYFINLKEFPFTILMPHTRLTPEEIEYCEEYKQCVTSITGINLTYDPTTYPANYKWHKNGFRIASYIRGDYLGHIEITENDLNGLTFEEVMKENEEHRNKNSGDEFERLNLALYYDGEGNLFFDNHGDLSLNTRTNAYYYHFLSEAGNSLKPLDTENTAMNKRYLSRGKNFQKAIENGDAKIVNAAGADFVRLASNPDKYYVVYNTNLITDKTNMIRVVDIFDEKGLSSFSQIK